MSFISDLLVNKAVSYAIERFSEAQSWLSLIVGIEASAHIDKLPAGFNQDVANGLVWLTVAAGVWIRQNWKPASSTSAVPPNKAVAPAKP